MRWRNLVLFLAERESRLPLLPGNTLLIGDVSFQHDSNGLLLLRERPGQPPVTIVVVNNGMFGTIRAHQERRFPDRPHGTDLVNPDFVAMAEAIGFTAFRVRETTEISDAFDRALKHDGPALVELVLDPEAISTRASLSKIRTDAKARQSS